MRFFTMQDFQYMALAYFCGLTAVFLVILAWTGYPHRQSSGSTPKDEPWDDLRILDEHDGEKNPVAPYLIVVYAGVAVWAISYMIVIGLRGPAF